MNGVLWAVVAGAGFGLFQSVNARAMQAGVGVAAGGAAGAPGASARPAAGGPAGARTGASARLAAGGSAASAVYASTFVQLLAAAAVLVVASLATTDVTVLADASAACLLLFAGAGVVHFFAGWTLLNLSQARIGAARTSPLLATTPLFGLVLGAVAATQPPAPAALGGIALTIAGALLVGRPLDGGRFVVGDAVFGLGTACAYAIGAVLIVAGLERFDHAPLLGVTVGVLAAAVAYGALLAVTRTPPLLGGSLRGGLLRRRPPRLGGPLRGVLVRRRPPRLGGPLRGVLVRRRPPRVGGPLRGVLGLKLLAGVIVALATWARWLALADAEVAVVLALNLASVPVVMLLAPLIAIRGTERVTPRIVCGAALVVVGALVLIVAAG